MTALEDIDLKDAREKLGVLFILTGNSSPVSFSRFVPDLIEGLGYFEGRGYLNVYGDGEDPSYELNEEGWNHARKILGFVNNIFIYHH